MRKQSYIAVCAVVVLGLALGAFAQQGAENAAPAALGKTPKSTVLLFREDFKTGKVGEVQLTQDASRIQIWNSSYTDRVRSRAMATSPGCS